MQLNTAEIHKKYAHTERADGFILSMYSITKTRIQCLTVLAY